MAEALVTLDTVNIGPKQRVNHAHIRDDSIALHWHKPGAEPKKAEGITISKEDWLGIMNSVYWKREETLEAQGAEGNNLVGAVTHVGFVGFRFKKGRKTVEEEVSVLSLQHVDARMRRRHREGLPG